MWVPIAVYTLFLLGIVRPEHFILYDPNASDPIWLQSLFGTLRFLFVFCIPMGLVACAVGGKPVRWIRWVTGPLALLIVLVAGFFILSFYDGPPAPLRAALQVLCLVTSILYLGECLRHREPAKADRPIALLGVLAAVSLWSLGGLAAMTLSIRSVTDGRPHGLWLEQTSTGYESPRSWHDLRAIDLGIDHHTPRYGRTRYIEETAVLTIGWEPTCWTWSRQNWRFEPFILPGYNASRIGCASEDRDEASP